MADESSASPDQGQHPGPAPGEIIASKYVVESLLGVGGMGVVLAARHLHLNQRVAIKLLRKEAGLVGTSTSRFLREARAAAAITSEHVARVLDVGTLETGLPYIVMEHLSGSDLAALIDARVRIPPAEAVDLVLQACGAIAEAHSLGIIHRDLKPSNIFVTHRADGAALVKVLDFGISKFQNPLAFAGEEATLTASGSVVGSPAYMSPEQIRSAKGTDARSDVWAMGLILYELVTGQNPFIGETIGDTLVKIASEPAPPVLTLAPEVPAGLALVIERCLERNPAARTPSIAELARALEPFAVGDASAFVARIVRVSASTRPFSVTPSDRAPAVTGGTPPRRVATPHEVEGEWRTPSPAPRRSRLGAGLGLAGVGALAFWGGTLRPRAQPESTQRDDLVSAAPVSAPLPSAVTRDAAAVGADASAGAPATSRPGDANAAGPPARITERHRPRHPVPAASSEPSAPAAPAPGANSASGRSLDDLLEGRH